MVFKTRVRVGGTYGVLDGLADLLGVLRVDGIPKGLVDRRKDAFGYRHFGLGPLRLMVKKERRSRKKGT
jgi:hypothetical protein